MPEADGPLKGIRILDLTRLLPGPLATQYMADLGAEVVKIEDPGFPDYTRFFPPLKGSQSLHYLAVNRSKKSLALKLNTEEGRAVFFEMVEKADIVIEQFRPGKIDDFGLGYDKAKAFNPGIIYVSISGYGQDGPMRDEAGHDLNYIGYAGITALTGSDHKMVMPGVQIADIMGGSQQAVIACMSALFARMRTGKGQQVDVSMTDGALQMLSLPLTEHMNHGTPYGPGEFMLSGGLANYHLYACKDGRYVCLGALEPKFWMAFCKMVSRPDWVSTAFSGPEKASALKKELEALFRTRDRDDWVAQAEGHDVCLTPALELDEIEGHALFKARNMIVEHEHPDYGSLKTVAQPIKFSESTPHKGWAAPLLGEHSREVLLDFGFSAERISSLVEDGIVGQK